MSLAGEKQDKRTSIYSARHTLGRDVPVLVLVLSSLSVFSSLRNEVRDDRDDVTEQNKVFDKNILSAAY